MFLLTVGMVIFTTSVALVVAILDVRDRMVAGGESVSPGPATEGTDRDGEPSHGPLSARP